VISATTKEYVSREVPHRATMMTFVPTIHALPPQDAYTPRTLLLATMTTNVLRVIFATRESVSQELATRATIITIVPTIVAILTGDART